MSDLAEVTRKFRTGEKVKYAPPDGQGAPGCGLVSGKPFANGKNIMVPVTFEPRRVPHSTLEIYKGDLWRLPADDGGAE